MNTFSANFIGIQANTILHSIDQVEVMGISSRGVFLKTNTRWILFISGEKYRGPLTINMPKSYKIHDYAQVGNKGHFKGQKFIFPASEIEVDIHAAIPWPPTASTRPLNPYKPEDIIPLLEKISDPILNRVITSSQPPPSLSNPIEFQIMNVFHGLQNHDLNQTELAAEKLLGLGIGLTPEGDDFITGLLFGLFNNHVGKHQEYQQMAANLVEKAYQKTNTISANLIECAASGISDERLDAAYLALRNNTDNSAQAVQELLNWGNTSGRMAFLGICTALLLDS